MKNIKTFLILSLILTSTTAFAVWTQPTATPPSGNTQPPINVGTVTQRKIGTIEAYRLCLVKKVGITETLDCLGGVTPGANTFPWVFGLGNAIENTNDETSNNGNVNIKDKGTTYDWIFDPTLGKLNVEGLVKAVGFCLGNDCIKTGTSANLSKTTTVNSWEELIKKYAGTGNVAAGDPKTINYITKWTNTTTPTISNSVFYEESGKLCVGTTAATKVCFGNGTDGTPGLPGIPGSDGTILKCGSADSGKVLQWNGTNWVCGVAPSSITINNTTATDKLKGTTDRIVKFTGSTAIGDSGMIETTTMIEADLKTFKATKGLIIPKYANDTNTLEEGAIWLNTSVVVQ